MCPANRKPIAVVAGHLCVDITPAFPAAARTLSDALQPGKLAMIGPMAVTPGGVVPNTGLALRRLGVETRLLGKAGADALGALLKHEMEAIGGGDAVAVDAAVATSYTLVLAPPGTDRAFLHHPGANDAFCADDVPDSLLEGASLLHFGYPPLMAGMYLHGGGQVARLFRQAKSLGLLTSLDMAAVDPASPAGQADWAALLQNVLPLTDIFTPSAEELCFMLDREAHAIWRETAPGADAVESPLVPGQVPALAERCIQLGAKVVLVKCGARGLYYRTGAQLPSGMYLDASDWADRSGFQPAFVPERIASTTGAGDTAIAAFLAGLLCGYPPKKCAALAAAAGAACVATRDVLSGIPTLAQLQARIDGGWATRAGAFA